MDKLGLYSWKNEFLKVEGYDEIDVYTFFEYLFWRGAEMQLQEEGYEHYYDKHYNAIALTLYKNEEGRKVGKNIILTQGLERIGFVRHASFAITSPITYVGRNRNSKNARLLYGICIDLDGVGEREMKNVLHHHNIGYTPEPNIIVNSGNGLHLYYLLEEPIALFDESKKLLDKLKHTLTECVWTAYTSTLKEKQYQGIFQGFRIPETKTKFGELVRAFSRGFYHRPYYTIAELAKFGPELMLLSKDEVARLEKARYFPDKLTLDEAKSKYPDWYERRIVRGEPRGRWHVKRDLYDWWLRRLRESYEVKVGHRYFCMMTLAMYALKCDVPLEELREDAYSLLEDFDSKEAEEDNHFTSEDVEDALKAYQESYATFPRDTISKITGIYLIPNKRNKRKQEVHLEVARAVRDVMMKVQGRRDWINRDGRKKGSVVSAEDSPKAKIVREWRAKNPSGTKYACSKETGIDKKTVRKWWDSGQDYVCG